MDKLKYIKVKTADRLPEETGRYHTEFGYMDFNEDKGLFYDHIEGFVMRPDFFFEPVPDKEEEMRACLQRILKIENKEFGKPSFNVDDLKRKIKRVLES